jgi:HlyD family secretion protein
MIRVEVPPTALALCVALLAACAPTGAPSYESVPVARGDLARRVTASGTLSAVVSVDVGSQVSGKIAALKVDFNSPVHRGELVAEIDPAVYVAALRQAEGDLDSARATALLKRQNLERKKILVPQKAASQLDLDQAVAELAQAEATIVIKQAVLDSARANLGYCKITSPVDGIVIARKVDVGQTVVAAMTTPVLFTIAQDITRMHISAAVAEADIGEVRAGESVQFTVDAFADEVFEGKVQQVRMSPTTTSNVVTYETIIDVDNPQRKLFPGMTADVSILAALRHAVLEIPNAALRFEPPDGARFDQARPTRLERNQRLVYEPGATPGTLRAQIVRAGITDGVDTEILEGLGEHDRVVTATLAGLAPKLPFGGGPPPRGP